MEVANIFWYGELTKLEIACVKSFVKHGFHVKLWSYNNLQVEGAESCDANLVVPEDKMFDVTLYHIDGKMLNKARATSFSDLFRYYLINKYGGWWFDADTICLKDVSEFKKLRQQRQIVIGYLEKGLPAVNNAVMHLSTELSNELVQHFESFMSTETKETKVWGLYGPNYVTNFVTQKGLITNILSHTAFYAIRWDEFDLFTDPNKFKHGRDRIKNSYIAHVWNTEFELRGLDKNNPRAGSLLHLLINK